MKKILALVAIALLASCENAPTGYVAEPITYSKPPIRVNVASITVVEDYQAPIRTPNVEHEFMLPPAVAVKEWAAERLKATGKTGTLEVVISDASVKETKLQKTKGLTGLFTDDQDSRYDASLNVTLRLYDGVNPISVAMGDVIITRMRTINEKATIDDRLRLFHAMTKDMMAAFDAQAEQRLRQYFSAYVR